jgi:hypothetical protein
MRSKREHQECKEGYRHQKIGNHVKGHRNQVEIEVKGGISVKRIYKEENLQNRDM